MLNGAMAGPASRSGARYVAPRIRGLPGCLAPCPAACPAAWSAGYCVCLLAGWLSCWLAGTCISHPTGISSHCMDRQPLSKASPSAHPAGIDYTHPDLAANIWTNPWEAAGQGGTAGLDDDGNGQYLRTCRIILHANVP